MSWEKFVIRFTKRILLAFLAGSAVASQGTAAEVVPELFVAEAISAEAAAAAVRSAFAYRTAANAEEIASHTAKTARTIEVDISLLSEDPDQLRVELPDGRAFVAVRKVSWTEEGDQHYWSGDLRTESAAFDENAAGTLTLSAEGGIVAGWLRAGGSSFEIVPLGEGSQQLIPVAASRGGGPAATCTEPAAEDGPAAGEDALRPVMVEGNPPASVVDVLVIFPRSLAATPTQLTQTRAKIKLWFGDANQVLANSDVSHRFRMVYGGPLYGAQPPGELGTQAATTRAVSWLGSQPEVAELRESWRPDMVALFVPADSKNECGVALLSSQVAAIDLGCFAGEYLVAHELGHLLSMRHADASEGASPPSSYPYSFGYDANNQLWIDNRRAATVMACNGDNNGAPNQISNGNQCNRIPFYSSSAIRVDGIAIGNDDANNAEVARQQMYLAAQQQPSIIVGNNLPPRVTIVRPQGSRAQSGQAITLSARAFDTEDGNIESSVRWTSNRRGSLGTGAQLRVHSSLLGSETITASVTDSGGLSHSRSTSIFFEAQVVTEGAIWHDPNTPGRFLSFNKNIQNHWVATWMAYEGSSPIWYLTGTSPVAANGSFSGQLQRFTRNVSTGQLTPSAFGTLTVAVETERQIRLRVTPLSGPAVDLMVEPYTRPVGPGAYVARVGGQVDPGWSVFRGPTAFGSPLQEARILTAFDGAQPVWVFGLGSPGGLPGQPFGLLMYRPTPANMTDNFKVPATSHNNSNLVFTENDTVWTSLYFPSGNSWIRSERPVEGITIR